MKKLVSFAIVLFSFSAALASHIVGGEMIYEYLGPGSASGTKQYRITLRLFRDRNCTNCAAMPANVFIGIYNNDNGAQFPAANQSYDVQRLNQSQVGEPVLPQCINNPPQLVYDVAYYTMTVDLHDNVKGYTAAYQTCCRVAPLANVFNSVGSGGGGGGGTGSTYACTIPGTQTVPLGTKNSSPQFSLGISVICHGKPFTLDFSATDSDGDVLVYSFCDAYNGGNATSSSNINPQPPSAAPASYGSVPYVNGFTGQTPLGSSVTVNSQTGIISGIAPEVGKYVVCVCIEEYRNGKLIGYHRKDFIVNVADCDFAGALLPAITPVCDTYSHTFINQNSSPLNQTFLWNFGDGTTSTQARPTHTYADTGSYNVTLTVNPGLPCGGTTTTVAKVYPGFVPAFDFTGICVNKPTQFKDRSTTRYGVVNSWAWNFGDINTLADSSHIQNPSYTYTQTGIKNVRLIVTSDKGCIDTFVNNNVTIVDKPPLSVTFKDTLLCRGDALQLGATGSGNFSWTPNTEITAANTATPIVTPSVTRTYKVQLDDNGCINTDSVKVRVVNFVTLRARGDTIICLTDSVQLFAISDGLRFQWTPAATIGNPAVINPMAKPVTTTTYQVKATIGSCSATDDVRVTTIPYPTANAGVDDTICYKTQTQLSASVLGTSFTWSPVNTLLNPATLTPTAFPVSTTGYVLTVRDSVSGCPKPSRDTVIVIVLPKINAFAGRDTSVVIGQPLQFAASGGVSYSWSPATGLSNAAIANPVGNYNEDRNAIIYRVIVGNAFGCVDSAFITVRVFKTAPRIFVPTAFTPNSDGKNDIIRPIAVGISKIEYFRIYNRWGHLVFSTTTNGAGWDGKINGKDQGTNVFVWLVKAVDFTGKEFFDKGTVTLIR